MTLKRMLGKIDRLFCAYLGLGKEEINPKTVQISGDKFFIGITLPFRRHLISRSWEKFTALDINKTSKKNKVKLGIATGKAIAKNLVVSFDVPSVRER